MYNYCTPESAGISSLAVLEFIKTLEEYELNTHSIIMERGNKIFTEAYYAPFNSSSKQRMYSVSKSFVSVAVGLLIEDGLLSLDDRLHKFFPEYSEDDKDDNRANLTIREMLTMETCNLDSVNWFTSGTKDRTEVYFQKPGKYISGTIFDYDSPGSFMLCAIVEKLTGKPFMDLLYERILSKTDFSRDAYCLKVPGGYSFGDSGVMCTSLDLLTFARFVMNYGVWNGERLMNEDYLKEATSKQVSNKTKGYVGFDSHGYGYQIWRTPDNTFSFVGMGDQFAICDPAHDSIFVITSDNQGNPTSRTIIFHELYKSIVRKLNDVSLPEDPDSLQELCDYISKLKLTHAVGELHSSIESKINGATYKLNDNPMNIEYVRFSFSDDSILLTYKNKQGEKCLPIGLGKNIFGKFPEQGYSDLVATVGVEGHMYECASSASWIEPSKLCAKIQIIDKYLGNVHMTFSFKDNLISVLMVKNAEAFLNEYNGYASGYAEI